MLTKSTNYEKKNVLWFLSAVYHFALTPLNIVK